MNKKAMNKKAKAGFSIITKLIAFFVLFGIIYTVIIAKFPQLGAHAEGLAEVLTGRQRSVTSAVFDDSVHIVDINTDEYTAKADIVSFCEEGNGIWNARDTPFYSPNLVITFSEPIKDIAKNKGLITIWKQSSAGFLNEYSWFKTTADEMGVGDWTDVTAGRRGNYAPILSDDHLKITIPFSESFTFKPYFMFVHINEKEPITESGNKIDPNHACIKFSYDPSKRPLNLA